MTDHYIKYLNYSEFHDMVIEKIMDILDSYQIRYSLITGSDMLFDTINSDNHNTTDQLLLIFTADYLKDCGRFNPEKVILNALNYLKNIKAPVIWAVAVENAESDYENIPSNVKFLHYGGDMLCSMNKYSVIAPQQEKNFNSDKFFISLSNAPRPARILAACCITGNTKNLLDHGVVRISPHVIENYQNWQDYYIDTIGNTPITTKDHYDIMQQGFLNIKNLCHGGQPAGDIYEGLQGLDNAGNFDRSLRHLYKNSFVEIVNESVFFSNEIFVTEKFLNSVYGYNLPIVLSTPGTVDYLRQHGFDMFDDVIDHSYDSISDPLQRIFTAIESNIHLLSDKKRTQQAWKHCKNRMDKNCQYAKTDMYSHFCNQFVDKFDLHIKSLKFN